MDVPDAFDLMVNNSAATVQVFVYFLTYQQLAQFINSGSINGVKGIYYYDIIPACGAAITGGSGGSAWQCSSPEGIGFSCSVICNAQAIANGVFTLGEGCSDYVAVFVSQVSGTLYPYVSVSYHPGDVSGSC